MNMHSELRSRSPLEISRSWQQRGVAVRFESAGQYIVPYIELDGSLPVKERNPAVILATGMHLEETSGPALLRQPEPILSVLQPFREEGLSFLLFPQINQFGSQFVGKTGAPELLRQDHRGVEYNDGFGLDTPARATAESRAVERVMRDYMTRFDVQLGISFHEDSDLPRQGYLWTNGVPHLLRSQVQTQLSSIWGGSRYLFESRTPHPSVQEDRESGEPGHWEDSLAVDFEDEGCLEHWWAKMCGIAAFCVEAPFGAHPKIRELFLTDLFNIVLTLQTEQAKKNPHGVN